MARSPHNATACPRPPTTFPEANAVILLLFAGSWWSAANRVGQNSFERRIYTSLHNLPSTPSELISENSFIWRPKRLATLLNV